MADDQDLPPAGWYPDPTHNTRERYWDGTAWDQPDHVSGLVPVGYLLAIMLPLMGFIIGVVLATRRDDRASSMHGPYVVIASLACAIFWLAAFTR